MNILQVNTFDNAGGAARAGWILFDGYRKKGHISRIVVRDKNEEDPDVVPILNDIYRNLWSRAGLRFEQKIRLHKDTIPGLEWLENIAGCLADPRSYIERRLGVEGFNYPGAWHLLDRPSGKPDILHCHNLHGGYFDLRALAVLSHRVPTILTLHDAWLLSGHCAHSFDCGLWKTGCGNCPDLTIYPAISRDATAYNFRRKQKIYAESRLYVSAPSKWLMDKLKGSMLGPSAVETRVIPYGVDLSVFRPADKRQVRSEMGFPENAKILLFTAYGVKTNVFKDYRTLHKAVSLVAENIKEGRVILVALGEDSPPERIGRAEVRFIPYQINAEKVARYYQAADVYIHAARADTFPYVILEALACGTPVVATAVGGIVEQVTDGETGYLVPCGDAEAMADRVRKILADGMIQRSMSGNAVLDARRRFDLDRYVDDHILWYKNILGKRLDNDQ